MRILSLFLIVLFTKLNSQTWSSVGAGMNLSPGSIVHAMYTFNGNLYCGGTFTTSGGVTTNNISKWSGTQWSALSIGTNDRVTAICEFNGELYIAGRFTLAGSNPANRIAKWNGSSWVALGSGLTGGIDGAWCMTVFNNELYVGGDFTDAGGTTVSSIAKWNGSAWSSVGDGFDSDVTSLAVMNSELYAGGVFTNSGMNSALRVAKWNGSTWNTVGGGMDNGVSKLVTLNNELYAGGTFQNVGGNSMKYVAKWNGSIWQAVGNGIPNFVQTLAVVSNELYASWYNGNIVKWNGSSWVGLGAPAFNNNAYAIEGFNSDLYAAGNFSVSGTTTLSCIARMNGIVGMYERDMSENLSFYPNPISGGSVVNLSTSSLENLEVTITDNLGRKVYTTIVRDQKINIHALSPGIYYLSVEATPLIKKLVIQD